MQKLRITKSLLDSWLWSFKRDNGYEDFLKTLNRESLKPTEAMLLGVQYENCLNNVLDGVPIAPDHEWYKPITEMAAELHGAQQQVTLFKETEVDGQTFLLHGVLDYLREGHIWDCKYSKHYYLNKYLGAPQCSMYLSLVPEAMDFTYIVSDGKWVYRERYPKEIVEPIEPKLRHFAQFLRRFGLWETYQEKWSVIN